MISKGVSYWVLCTVWEVFIKKRFEYLFVSIVQFFCTFSSDQCEKSDQYVKSDQCVSSDQYVRVVISMWVVWVCE
jgi:hypothetical protein